MRRRARVLAVGARRDPSATTPAVHSAATVDHPSPAGDGPGGDRARRESPRGTSSSRTHRTRRSTTRSILCAGVNPDSSAHSIRVLRHSSSFDPHSIRVLRHSSSFDPHSFRVVRVPTRTRGRSPAPVPTPDIAPGRGRVLREVGAERHSPQTRGRRAFGKARRRVGENERDRSRSHGRPRDLSGTGRYWC